MATGCEPNIPILQVKVSYVVEIVPTVGGSLMADVAYARDGPATP